MSNSKRETVRPHNHEDCQAAKKPRIVKPRSHKPIPPYVEHIDFEYEQMQSKYCYEWFRKNCYENRRPPLYFQHEPFHCKHQPNPRVVYFDSFAERRTPSLYQAVPGNSEYESGSHCKTKIFNPVVNCGYMRSPGDSKVSNRRSTGDEVRYGSSMPEYQAELIERNRLHESRHGVRPKPVDEVSYRSKKQIKEVKGRESHVKKDEEMCKNEKPNEETPPCESRIDIERQRKTTVAFSTESQPEASKRMGRHEEKDAGSNAKIDKIRKREIKLRRKAFTVASSLMEKINEKQDDQNTLKNEQGLRKEARAGENVACRVFGLLSLQGSRERRYEITVEELRRRVSAPEHLNKVDMISYLRLAKNSARLLLEKYDIINSLHHRLSKHTILSKVSEKECEDLASGIHDINMSYFPFRVVANHSLNRVKEVETNGVTEVECLKKRYQDLETARSVLREVCGTLESMHDTKELIDFRNITHTFGIQNMSNHVQFFEKYFKEEEELILQTLKGK